MQNSQIEDIFETVFYRRDELLTQLSLIGSSLCQIPTMATKWFTNIEVMFHRSCNSGRKKSVFTFHNLGIDIFLFQAATGRLRRSKTGMLVPTSSEKFSPLLISTWTLKMWSAESKSRHFSHCDVMDGGYSGLESWTLGKHPFTCDDMWWHFHNRRWHCASPFSWL